MANEFPNDALLTVGTTAMMAEVGYMQVHSGDPGAGGTANVVSGVAREAVAVTLDADGDFTLNGTIVFTGGTPGGPGSYFSFWDTLTGGTWYGNRPSSASSDKTFNSSGELEVVAVNGTATTA